MIFFLTAVSL